VLQGQPPRFGAREIEHVLEHAQQRLARLLRELEITPLLRRRRERLRELRHAQHAVQRRAQLVAHVRQERRLGLVRALGGVLLRLGLRQRLGQAAGALAHPFLEHGLLRLQRLGRELVVVHVVQRADQDRRSAVGIGPDAHAPAEPAVVAEPGADARLALRFAQRRGGVRVGLVDERQVLRVDALAQRVLEVRQLVVGEAQHALVARRVPGFAGLQVTFPDPFAQAVEQPAVPLLRGFEQAARTRFGSGRRAGTGIVTHSTERFLVSRKW